MTSLAVVEQTHLAELIQQREELQETLKRLKKRLKDYQNWSQADVEHGRQRSREWNQSHLAQYSGLAESSHSKLAAARAFETDRLWVMNYVVNDDLRVLLERQNKELEIDRLEREIQGYEETARRYREDLDKPEEPIVDPRIELTNHMAVTEQALEDVQAKIRLAKKTK